MALALGFDFGRKRIGLAVGDIQGISVRPLTTLAAIKGLPQLDETSKYIGEFQPKILVVGLPQAGGAAVETSRTGAETLAMWLRKHFALPVAMCDESYSSVISPKDARDAHAACIILRDWIIQQAGVPKPIAD